MLQGKTSTAATNGEESNATLKKPGGAHWHALKQAKRDEDEKSSGRRRVAAHMETLRHKDAGASY